MAIPTQVQLEFLALYKRLSRELKRPPSLSELEEVTGKGRNSTMQAIKILERDKLIAPRLVTKKEGYEITPLGNRWLKFPTEE